MFNQKIFVKFFFFFFTHHFFFFSRDSVGWFDIQYELCKYANIPLANLEADFPIFIADVLFSRLLKKLEIFFFFFFG